MACTADEIDEKPLGRKICGINMVFYRGVGNQVAALDDFCPHRGAPLSLGKVCEGKLVCGYHGLEMGCDGKTVAMPGQRVGGFPAITSYAVQERYGFIWVWPGERALADPGQIQHLEWHDHPDWAYGGGLFHIGCDYRLMIDNLMDLTHETYVHSTSIGQPEIDETPCETKVDGEKVITQRFMEDIAADSIEAMLQAYSAGTGLSTSSPETSVGAQSGDYISGTSMQLRGFGTPAMTRDGLGCASLERGEKTPRTP